MDAIQLAALLRDYGPWGLLALTLLALRWLFGKYDAAQEARIVDAKKGGEALATASRVIDDNTKATVEVAKLQTAQEARLAVLADRLDRGRS